MDATTLTTLLLNNIDPELADAILDNDPAFLLNHATPARVFARRLGAHSSAQ